MLGVIAVPPRVLVRLDSGFDHRQQVLHCLGLLVELVEELWHSTPFTSPSELGLA